VHVPEEFIISHAHSIQVMVWSGIGPHGDRTALLRCPPSVNAENYIRLLAENRIIHHLNEDLSVHQWLFQKGNTPAHGWHRELPAKHMPFLDWPAES
jgi:hypothetical protein